MAHTVNLLPIKAIALCRKREFIFRLIEALLK